MSAGSPGLLRFVLKEAWTIATTSGLPVILGVVVIGGGLGWGVNTGRIPLPWGDDVPEVAEATPTAAVEAPAPVPVVTPTPAPTPEAVVVPPPPEPTPPPPPEQHFPATYVRGKALPVAVDDVGVQHLAQAMMACEGVVTVKGHTCNLGAELQNERLGKLRADDALRRLVEAGFPEGRLRASSSGSREPLASNATAGGRADNRRVMVGCAD